MAVSFLSDRLARVPAMLSFAIPSAWRRFVLPRRADALPMPAVQAVRVGHAAELLSAFQGDVLSSLVHPNTPADVSAAGRAYLSGDPAAPPLGAGAVAQAISGILGWSRLDEAEGFGDYWRDRHGLAFAAAATAELAGLYPVTSGSAARSSGACPTGMRRVTRRPLPSGSRTVCALPWSPRPRRSMSRS